MIFPFGYSHSRPIPKTRTEQESVNASSRRSSNRKTVRQKTGHQSSKNNIHNTLKIRQNISTDILQNVVYIMVERLNGKEILGNFFLIGTGVTHIPIYLNCQLPLLPIPIPELVSFPIPMVFP